MKNQFIAAIGAVQFTAKGFAPNVDLDSTFTLTWPGIENGVLVPTGVDFRGTYGAAQKMAARSAEKEGYTGEIVVTLAA